MRLVIPLLFLCFTAQAQDIFTTVQQRASVALCDDKDLIGQAKENATVILSAYRSQGDLQKVVDGFDDRWFNDLDLFISPSIENALEFIEECDNAYFLTHTGKVLIDVTETSDLCVVTIYTMP